MTLTALTISMTITIFMLFPVGQFVLGLGNPLVSTGQFDTPMKSPTVVLTDNNVSGASTSLSFTFPAGVISPSDSESNVMVSVTPTRAAGIPSSIKSQGSQPSVTFTVQATTVTGAKSSTRVSSSLSSSWSNVAFVQAFASPSVLFFLSLIWN